MTPIDSTNVATGTEYVQFIANITNSKNLFLFENGFKYSRNTKPRTIV